MAQRSAKSSGLFVTKDCASVCKGRHDRPSVLRCGDQGTVQQSTASWTRTSYRALLAGPAAVLDARHARARTSACADEVTSVLLSCTYFIIRPSSMLSLHETMFAMRAIAAIVSCAAVARFLSILNCIQIEFSARIQADRSAGSRVHRSILRY